MVRNRTIAIGVLSIAIVLLGSTVYAVLSQNTPLIIVPAPPSLTSTCSSLVAEGMIQPISGVILLDCGSSTAAFTVVNQNKAVFTPTFSLPSVPIGTVGPLEVSQTSNNCAQGTGFILTSGQSLPLPSGQYDYCLGYGGFPTTGQSIPSFPISWS